MIRTYLLLFIRTSLKNRKLLLINLLSFTACLTLFFFIALVINHEFGFNRGFKNAERIYRVATTASFKDRVENLSLTCAFVGPTLKETFPEVERYARLKRASEKAKISINEDKTYSDKVFAADSDIFKVLQFALVSGDSHHALAGLNNAVISDRFRQKYFKNIDPLGQELKINDEVFLVSGVVAVAATDFDIDIFIRIDRGDLNDFEWVSTFLLVESQDFELEGFKAKIQSVINSKLVGEFNADVINLTYSLMPLRDLHFSEELYESFIPRNKTVLVLVAIGTVLLIISACFNYGNFSFALALNRMKEISIKKLYGATGLMVLLESIGGVFILLLLSCLASFAILFGYGSYFKSVFGVEIGFGELFELKMILVYFLALLLISVVSAFLFYGFFIRKIGGNWRDAAISKVGSLQKGLLMIQLSVGLSTVVATYFIRQQTNLITNFDKGFAVENVLVVPFISDSLVNFELLRHSLSEVGIMDVSFCNSNSLPGVNSKLELFRLNDTTSTHEFMAKQLFVDANFFRVLNIKINDRVKDTLNVNSVFISKKIKTEQLLKLSGFDKLNGKKIIGITENVYFNSAYGSAESMVFAADPSNYNTVLMKVGSSRQFDSDRTKAIWERFFEGQPFEYQFLDDIYGRLYSDDLALGNMLLLLSLSIAVISVLGILSISSLSAVKRIKEFAIRRSLGATRHNILALLSSDLIKLFAVAILISIPVVFWLLNYWMSRYAVRADLDVITMASIELALCLLTVVINALSVSRTINVNPVAVLREN